MRVLMLSWEYPPLVVGGLGRHVDALARALVARGHEVTVVTRGTTGSVTDEFCAGVRVVRCAMDPVAVDFTTESLLAWAQVAEHSMLRAALPIARAWRPDVVHAHDWLVAQTAITLADTEHLRLVATLHATEFGRHRGWLPAPLNRAIHSIERWLAQRADAVITCSSSMRTEVIGAFGVRDVAGLYVIPNGIDADRWAVTPAERRRARLHNGRLLVFAGRLVHEKGLHTLLDVLPRLPTDVRLAVAGTGHQLDAWQERARQRRVIRRVDWLGFVEEPALRLLFAAADAVVVPSLYEPFGLVALEAAASGAPLILADTGGLRELRNLAAATCPPDDPDALTRAVNEVLVDATRARRTATRAIRTVRREHTWDAVAAATERVYLTEPPDLGDP